MLFPRSVHAEVAVVGDQSAIGPPFACPPIAEKLPPTRIPVASSVAPPAT